MTSRAAWIPCAEEEKRERLKRERRNKPVLVQFRLVTTTGLARLSQTVFSGVTGGHVAQDN
jgi:hypothetical protein